MLTMQKQMTDKDHMQDLLLTAKTLTTLYHFATQESSTEQIFTQFKSNLNSMIDMQHNIYSAMAQNGWYPQENADQTQIGKVKMKFVQGN